VVIATEGLMLGEIFLSLILILCSAHLCGYLFHKLKMPKVVGEIMGGFLFGPTILGHFFPQIVDKVFNSSNGILAFFYWLGLILLMFCSGLEVKTSFSKQERKTIGVLTTTTTIIPLIAGFVIALLVDPTKIIGEAAHPLALKLVIAVAIAITSIPVISKIFLDLGLMETAFAKIVLATATIHDLILWVFLAVATGLVSSTVPTISSIAGHIIVTLLFFGFALLVVPKIILYIHRKHLKIIPDNYEIGFILVVLFLFVLLAQYSKVNLVFGGFLAGIIFGFLKNERFEKAKKNIKEVSFALFIPIYFAVVGLKLNLLKNFDPLFFLLFLVAALLIQGITVFFTSKKLGYSSRSSFNLAAALNARGGPCIVLATVALDARIINDNFFVTLILLAIVTSLIAGWWLRYVQGIGCELLEESNNNYK